MDAIRLESVFTTVNAIYEAAFDQERWQEVVFQVRDLFGGSRACILRYGQDGDAIQSISDPELKSLAAWDVLACDPLVRAHLAMPVGAVWQRSEVIDETEFRRRELWHDWFRPRDMHNELVCKLAGSSSANWFLDVNRGPRQEAFSATDIAVMQKIAPHMMRAGQISRQVTGARAASSFLNLPFGLLLVDGNQRLLQMNEAAEALLVRSHGPLTLSGGLIGTSDPAVARNLARLIADACSLSDGVTPGLGGSLLVSAGHDASGSVRCVLSVAPYRNADAYGLTMERCAAIMVTEIAPRVHEGFEAHIRAVFKLTEAEARLAAGLASGLSIAESADRNGVTYRTARTYLDRIFRKTDTHHQSQLVAVLKTVQPLVASTAD
jgi:DNA-binding CsgD family transcriptional regulator